MLKKSKDISGNKFHYISNNMEVRCQGRISDKCFLGWWGQENLEFIFVIKGRYHGYQQEHLKFPVHP